MVHTLFGGAKDRKLFDDCNKASKKLLIKNRFR